MIDSIQDWQQPEITEINAMLMMGAPPVPSINDDQYTYQISKFKNYYAEKEVEGSYIQTQGRRKDMLVEWIKRDYQRNKPKYQIADTSTSARPHSNRSDSFDAAPAPSKQLSHDEQIAANVAAMKKAGVMQ